MSARLIDIPLHESRSTSSTDKNSDILHHLQSSENCRALCSEDCFSIDSAIRFQLKIKGALHIHWEKPIHNRPIFRANLSLVI